MTAVLTQARYRCGRCDTFASTDFAEVFAHLRACTTVRVHDQVDMDMIADVVERLRRNGVEAYLLRTRLLLGLIEAATLVGDHGRARALKRQLEELVLAGPSTQERFCACGRVTSTCDGSRRACRDLKPDNTASPAKGE